MKTIIMAGLIIMCQFSTEYWTHAEPSRRTMRVAGYQMDVGSDIQKNKKIILDAIQKAVVAKADFLVTPEGSLSGYNATFDRVELATALDEVVQAAQKAKLGLLLGTCYKDVVNDSEMCWNQLRVYSPEGEYLGAYSKILRCSPTDLPGTGEMLDYVEGTIKTFEWNGIRFGALVCNDFWATPGYTTKPNPYLPLKMKQAGAEVIFHVINSGNNQKYKAFHESSVELWASALNIPVVEVNASKGSNPVNAQSGLVNGQGERSVKVPPIGSQFFICELEF